MQGSLVRGALLRVSLLRVVDPDATVPSSGMFHVKRLPLSNLTEVPVEQRFT